MIHYSNKTKPSGPIPFCDTVPKKYHFLIARNSARKIFPSIISLLSTTIQHKRNYNLIISASIFRITPISVLDKGGRNGGLGGGLQLLVEMFCDDI